MENVSGEQGFLSRYYIQIFFVFFLNSNRYKISFFNVGGHTCLAFLILMSREGLAAKGRRI